MIISFNYHCRIGDVYLRVSPSYGNFSMSSGVWMQCAQFDLHRLWLEGSTPAPCSAALASACPAQCVGLRAALQRSVLLHSPARPHVRSRPSLLLAEAERWLLLQLWCLLLPLFHVTGAHPCKQAARRVRSSGLPWCRAAPLVMYNR